MITATSTSQHRLQVGRLYRDRLSSKCVGNRDMHTDAVCDLAFFFSGTILIIVCILQREGKPDIADPVVLLWSLITLLVRSTSTLRVSLLL